MRFEELPGRLVVRDEETKLRYLGFAFLLAGLTIAIVPWIIPTRDISPRRYAMMAMASAIGAGIAGWGLRTLLKCPTSEAVFEKDNRRLIYKRNVLSSKAREVAFKSIEMVMVAEKAGGDNMIYRLSVGTRSGERLPISTWKKRPGEVHEIARSVNLWMRSTLPSENKTESTAERPGGVGQS